jgi:hypothetical protein
MGYQVSLWLLDIAKKQVIRSKTDDVKELGPTDLERKGKELYTSIAGVADKGTLIVTANVDSGQVFIDDQFKSNLVKGQAKIVGIHAQRYRLGVESQGFQRYDGPVTVSAGQTTTETVTLEKISGGNGDISPPGECPPGFERRDGTCKKLGETEGTVSKRPGGMWRKLAWAGAIVAVASGGVWAVSYVAANQVKPDADPDQCAFFSAKDGALARSNDQPLMGEALEKLDRACFRRGFQYIAIPMTALGAGVAITGFVLGYVKTGNVEGNGSAGRRVKKSPITLTPVVGPDGGGATVRIDW